MKVRRCKTEHMCVNGMDTGVTVKLQGAEVVKVDEWN